MVTMYHRHRKLVPELEPSVSKGKDAYHNCTWVPVCTNQKLEASCQVPGSYKLVPTYSYDMHPYILKQSSSPGTNFLCDGGH